MSLSDSVDDLNISVCAIAYYLYRRAGCPFGDNMSGLSAWIDVQKTAFEAIADPDSELNSDGDKK